MALPWQNPGGKAPGAVPPQAPVWVSLEDGPFFEFPWGGSPPARRSRGTKGHRRTRPAAADTPRIAHDERAAAHRTRRPKTHHDTRETKRGAPQRGAHPRRTATTTTTAGRNEAPQRDITVEGGSVAANGCPVGVAGARVGMRLISPGARRHSLIKASPLFQPSARRRRTE